VTSFALLPTTTQRRVAVVTTPTTLCSSSSSSTTEERRLAVPLTPEEMIRQLVGAVKEASSQGQTRQICRILLPRDAASGDFGLFAEASNENARGLSLVPPDESWQGGIMQLYRAVAPVAEQLVRAMTTAAGGVPPRVTEDRSVDESGVDGVGLFSTEDSKVQCWLQPTQENIDAMVASAKKASEEDLVVILNPQWRLVDDALDTYSKGEGFLGSLANFLGGKGGALKLLQETGFTPVYTLEGYVCRGYNVRLLQVLESDWNVFCENKDGESFAAVGSMSTRPTYQEVNEMLENAGIDYAFMSKLS
jgi:hypothetical protein